MKFKLEDNIEREKKKNRYDDFGPKSFLSVLIGLSGSYFTYLGYNHDDTFVKMGGLYMLTIGLFGLGEVIYDKFIINNEKNK